MLATFAIIAATLGLLLIVFLVLREIGSETAAAEKNMLYAACVLVVAVGAWQVIAGLTGAAH